MKRILLATGNQNDTTSFLRAWGPFTTPEMRAVCSVSKLPKDPQSLQDWSTYYGYDAIFLHRPHTPTDEYIMYKAKNYGIPLWVDHDDDLLNVPVDNPHFAHFNAPGIRDTVKASYELADILTYGGKTHWESIKKSRASAIHIPGALDDRLIRFKRPFNDTKDSVKSNRRYAWRGSDSHAIDLIYFADSIKAMGDIRPRFFGLNPYWLELKGMAYEWRPKTTDHFEFLAKLAEYNAHIHFVPLIENFFNHVKSNLAWQDATLAGSVCFVPTATEYLELPFDGIGNYVIGNNESYRDNWYHFNKLDYAALSKMHDVSWDYLRDNLLLSKVNAKRVEIVKNL